jgi:hypothetical protein
MNLTDQILETLGAARRGMAGAPESSSAIFELEDLGERATDLRVPVAAADTNVAG